jgi:hypothetical protein
VLLKMRRLRELASDDTVYAVPCRHVCKQFPMFWKYVNWMLIHQKIRYKCGLGIVKILGFNETLPKSCHAQFCNFLIRHHLYRAIIK